VRHTPPTASIDVYLEVGAKRTFAGAVEWPGWCRSGRDEASAIDALLGYTPRYADALRGSRLGFHAPSDVRVVERLRGDATTDFGAPSAAPSADAEPMADADLRRAQALLQACWSTFDGAVEIATGRELRKGPRGGGRDLDRIVEHVLGADAGYLSRIGIKLGGPRKDLRAGLGGHGQDLRAELGRSRSLMLEGLGTAVREGVPAAPRGGARWSPQYFVRRVAWHVLDHAWEIADRAEG
jgi:hypothetical protein